MIDMAEPKTTAKKTGKFGKGNPGRPPGSPNKVTQEFRETIAQLLDGNRESVAIWLRQVAEGDLANEVKPDPGKALDLLAKLAEFAAPKLARTEVVGDGGGPVILQLTNQDVNL